MRITSKVKGDTNLKKLLDLEKQQSRSPEKSANVTLELVSGEHGTLYYVTRFIELQNRRIEVEIPEGDSLTKRSEDHLLEWMAYFLLNGSEFDVEKPKPITGRSMPVESVITPIKP